MELFGQVMELLSRFNDLLLRQIKASQMQFGVCENLDLTRPLSMRD